MWINSRDRDPERDGQYIVQTVAGHVDPMNYTVAGGWNTFINSDGELEGDAGFNDGGWVARWFEVPIPPLVPKAWYEEWSNH